MYKIFFTIPLCLFVAMSWGQSVSTQMSARAEAMGNTNAPLSDPYSLFNNVAGIAKSESMEISTSYQASPALPGANRMAMCVTVPFAGMHWSAGLFRFGDALYNEQQLSIAVGNKLGLASLGLRGNVIQYNAEGFGTKRAFTIDFGGIVEFTKNLLLGAYITNLNQPTLVKDADEHTPTKLALGIGFRPAESFLFCAQVEKDLEYHPTWKGGFEYNFKDKFQFRSGYNLNPNAAFGGVGFRLKKMTIDYSVTSSLYLGISHQASITFRPAG